MRAVTLFIGVVIALVGCVGVASPTAQPPTQSAAATLTVPPTATASPTPTPPTTTPSGPTQSVAPTPTAVNTWRGPERLAIGPYLEPSLVVDGQGRVRAAATRGRDLYYLAEDASGWTEQRLADGYLTSTDGSIYWGPQIELDSDASVWIAFMHAQGTVDPFGFWTQAAPTEFVSNRSGEWSEPRVIGVGDDPAWVVRDGTIHWVAHDPFIGDLACGPEDEPVALTYKTGSGGALTSAEVADEGLSGRIAITSEGLPRIAFSGGDYLCGDGTHGLRYATTSTAAGEFTIEDIAGTEPTDQTSAILLDPADQPLVVFCRYDSDSVADCALWYSQRDASGWRQPQLIMAGARPLSAAIDARGTSHVIASNSDGLWYANNRSGQFVPSLLWAAGSDVEGWWSADGSIAVGPDGRPHILFAFERVPDSRRSAEIWYAVGPAV